MSRSGSPGWKRSPTSSAGSVMMARRSSSLKVPGTLSSPGIAASSNVGVSAASWG